MTDRPTAKRRALTDEQVEIADKIIAVVSGHAHADAFKAMLSIMAATINDASVTEVAAIASTQFWGQTLLDLVVEGRAGAFEVR